MNVSLVMFKADGKRRDFPLTKQRIVVGRKNDCDLRIPLTSVSRQHCEVRVEDQIIKVRDLGSSNGTYHNNNRVQEANLSAGDEIVVGPVVFTVVIDGYPEDVRPVRTIVDSHTDNNSDSIVTPVGEPQKIESPEDSAVMDNQVEEEPHSPTVDLDDPIAALEALANEESSDDDFYANNDDAGGFDDESESADDSEDDPLALLGDDDEDEDSDTDKAAGTPAEEQRLPREASGDEDVEILPDDDDERQGKRS